MSNVAFMSIILVGKKFLLWNSWLKNAYKNVNTFYFEEYFEFIEV